MAFPCGVLSEENDVSSTRSKKKKSYLPKKNPGPSSPPLRLSMGCGGGPWATYHARPGVGDTTLVGHPLVHGPLLVCKGSKEGPAHIIHAVHAHCGTLEDATAGGDASEGPRRAQPAPPGYLPTLTLK